MKYHLKVIVWLIMGLLCAHRVVAAEAGESLDPIRLGVTTGLQDSGLLDYLLPVFTREYGYSFIRQPVGSGKALRLGRRGEVDGVWVNSPSAENLFVEQGYGIERYPVMRTDFVILGPVADPAGVATSKNALDALAKLFTKESIGG